MSDENKEKFLDDMAYKSAHSLSKTNPKALADLAFDSAVLADRYKKMYDDVCAQNTKISSYMIGGYVGTKIAERSKMTDDIVEQLRRGIEINDIGKEVVSMFIHPKICDEAVNEIERLRKLLSDTNTFYAECIAEREDLKLEVAELKRLNGNCDKHIKEVHGAYILEHSGLRSENEKLRKALIGVTGELGNFIGIFKGYQGMTMSSAQSALNSAKSALRESVDE